MQRQADSPLASAVPVGVGRRSAYQELARSLSVRISSGEFPGGSALPAEHALAEHYGVSRKTVRNALVSLEQRGVVISRRGAGWFIAAERQTQALDELRTFSQWAISRGRAVGGLFVERKRGVATAPEAMLLRLRLGDEVLRDTRLRTLDGCKVMVERSTWAPWVAEVIDGFPDDIVSTTDGLAEQGIEVTFGNHRIDAVAASKADAQLLGVRRGSPLLRVRREMFARDGRVVEAGEDRYLPGTITFAVDAAGAPPRVIRTTT
jgi:GntR family transcriptional regulator